MRCAARRSRFTDREKQIRDFTPHVDDVVEANILVALKPIAPGSVFNVAGGSSVSVNEILDLFSELHGSPLKIERAAGVRGDVPQHRWRLPPSTEHAVGWRPPFICGPVWCGNTNGRQSGSVETMKALFIGASLSGAGSPIGSSVVAIPRADG